MRRENYGLLQQAATTEVASPKPSLAFVDAVALIVGVVIGAGIFETPARVAANTASNVAISLLVLRMRETYIMRPFRVPLYPFTPLLFCACGYLLYSSLVYTGVGAMAGVLVVGLGSLFL